jgi:hypothetical protein
MTAVLPSQQSLINPLYFHSDTLTSTSPPSTSRIRPVLKHPRCTPSKIGHIKRVSFAIPAAEIAVIVGPPRWNPINAPARQSLYSRLDKFKDVGPLPTKAEQSARKSIRPLRAHQVLITSKLTNDERREYSVDSREFIPSRILSRVVSDGGKVKYKVRFRDEHIAIVFPKALPVTDCRLDMNG